MDEGDKFSELTGDPLLGSFAPYFKNSFIGRYVRVCGDDHSYKGWCFMVDTDSSSVLLYDAERDDGKQFSDVFVSNASAIECLSGEKQIRTVDIELVRPSPYSVREYDDTHVRGYSRWFRSWGHLVNFPEVRPIHHEEYEYEIVSGHRRLKAAKKAGFDELQVQIVDVDEWEATRQFVDEHIPLPYERDKDGHGYYSDEDIEATLEIMLERWPSEELRKLDALEPYLEAYEE